MRDDSTSEDAPADPLRSGSAELVVVRHGQSTWNVDSLFTGQADPPLSQLGRVQATELGRRCLPLTLDAVAASDLTRALSTAQSVATALGLPPPTPVPLLRERWSRTLQGLHRDEIERRFPGQLSAWREARQTDLPGDNEDYATFQERIVRGLLEAARCGRRVLVVAHAGVFVVLDQLSGSRSAGRVGNADGRRLSVLQGRIASVGPVFAAGDTSLSSGREDP